MKNHRKKYTRKFNVSFAQKYPDLLKDWLYERNTIDPNEITYGSRKEMWFKCHKCGYIRKCALRNIKRLPCFNCRCLNFLNPELASEWHLIKNGKLTPYDVASNSHKKVWWKCSKCGFVWMAMVRNRNLKVIKGCGCKRCSKSRLSNGNCLDLKNPKLTKQWHPTKNGSLKSSDVSPSSTKKVWWKCKKGHEWPAIVASRNAGKNCPYCAGQKVCLDNCFATMNPELAKEWHPTKNNTLTPYDITSSSGRSFWWKCSCCGFEWYNKVSNRQKSGCPNCNKVVLKNGEVCDSLIEAYFYLKYKKLKLKFFHNKKYGSKAMGNRKYDFYFPYNNLYVEVTSFSKKYKYWKTYYKNILYKKKIVKKELRARFEFIRMDVDKKMIEYVMKNTKKFSKEMPNLEMPNLEIVK
jgi:hypothetical protein